MDVVWLKRDVRLHDHVPLATAASSGKPFAVLYIYEPDQLDHESVHGSHIAFVNEGLQEMEARFRQLAGGKEPERYITTYHAEATAALEALHAKQPMGRLLSHQETGHNASFARDRRVAKWCRQHGVVWQQVPQSTVVRGLAGESNPDTAAGTRTQSLWYAIWQAHLESFLQADSVEDPFESSPGGAQEALARRLVRPHVDAKPDDPACVTTALGPRTPSFPSACALGLKGEKAEDRPYRQKGGECKALALLAEFLHERGERYSGNISSPNSAWTACSRLSPYISWGQISIRTIWQNVEGRRVDAKGGKWKRSLQAYLVRLQWRSSYCQRFEMRCWMEHKNICHAWEHLLQGHTYAFGDSALLGSMSEEERINAFKQGRTGYPMVDACMRCLLSTGWLNFRMRCMLVSFAVFNLWLDWRCIAGHLAQCFLDYEPGIHYPQLQMQAGTTGCDLRCYSVIRQAKDQDPKAEFIKRYVSELRDLPADAALEPWKAKHKGLAAQYPSRIVDDVKTSKVSKTVIAAYQEWFQARGSRNGKSPSLETILSLSTTDQKATKPNASASKPSGARQGPAAKRRRTEDEAEDGVGADGGETHGDDDQSFIAQEHLFALLRRDDAQENAASANAGPWSCPTCTLINGLKGASPPVCDACGGPRPVQATCAESSVTLPAKQKVVIDLD